jgi:hypothetical protein
MARDFTLNWRTVKRELKAEEPGGTQSESGQRHCPRRS